MLLAETRIGISVLYVNCKIINIFFISSFFQRGGTILQPTDKGLVALNLSRTWYYFPFNFCYNTIYSCRYIVTSPLFSRVIHIQCCLYVIRLEHVFFFFYESSYDQLS